MRTVTPSDREPDDAPTANPVARRRRRLGAALAFLAFVVVVFVVARRTAVAPEVVDAAPVSPSSSPAPSVPIVAAAPPPAAAPAPSSATAKPTTRPPAARGAQAGAPRAQRAVVVDRVSGDPVARAAVARALRQRLQEEGVDEGDGANVAITLRADGADVDGGATRVRCSVSLARQPGRQVAGSLSAHADVEGEGVPPAELAADAAQACGAALADDLAAWLRRHP
jgi:hypothetical protein